MKRFVVIAFALLLSGCSTTATMYPIAGPLSQMSPVPVLVATADGIMGNTGSLTVTMPDGEVCKGRWSSIAPTFAGFSSGTATGIASDGMRSVWATVYGSGYTVGNVPGVNKGEAVLVGSTGTVIQVEFYTGSGTANGSGVAKDNKGNVFKVIF